MSWKPSLFPLGIRTSGITITIQDMQTIANHRQNQKQRRGLAFLGKRRELGGVVSPESPEGSWRLLAGWAAAGSDPQGSQSGEKFPSSCWIVRWFASSCQDVGACLFRLAMPGWEGELPLQAFFAPILAEVSFIHSAAPMASPAHL